jgi:poly(3-hydroxybutyrate) depolymerase
MMGKLTAAFAFLALASGVASALQAATPAKPATEPATMPAITKRVHLPEIPLLRRVFMDRDVTDWKGQGLVIRALSAEGPLLRSGDQFDAVGRLGWNHQGLMLQANVVDPTPFESNRIYEGDSVELLMIGSDPKAGLVQAVVSPGRDPQHPTVRVQPFDYRARAVKNRNGAIKPKANVTKSKTGYTVDLMLPWESLGIKPYEGMRFGVQFAINDFDGKTRQRLIWLNGATKPEWEKLPAVRLGAKPVPDVTTAVWGGYDEMSQAYINFVGETDSLGRNLDVWENGNLLSTTSITSDNDRTVARVRLPIPPAGQTYGPLTVNVGGKQVATLRLEDINKVRKDRFLEGGRSASPWSRTPEYLKMRCAPDVFTGEQLPAAAYPEPDRIKALVGSWTTTTDYYDVDGNKVERAAKPGRYGAVITVTSAAGDSFTVYQTLCRTESAGGKDAIALAGNAQGAADPAKADRDWWHSLRKKLGNAIEYEYFVRLPQGYDEDPAKRWPVIFYLHGSGGGEKLEDVQNGGVQTKAKTKADFPFIAVSLRSPGGWSVPAVKDVVNNVQAKYRTDATRYYLTGFSMGGFGTWAVALDEPTRFAAIAPVGGGQGDPSKAALLKNLPAWVINGADDGTTTSAEALKMVNALKKVGDEVKWTNIPNAGHVDSHDAAYSWDELFAWFLKHHQ